MYRIDLHCDTVGKLAGRVNRYCLKGNLMENPFGVDVKRLEKTGGGIQCFSTFFLTGHVPSSFREDYAYQKAKKLISWYHRDRNLTQGRLQPIRTAEDLKYCFKHRVSGGLLTLEDAVPTAGDPERLREFYDLGIRLITLTWNYENALGYPNSQNASVMMRGLKPAGREMVEEMNRLGIIIDVSHLSDGGFWDVARISKKPFIASHSNARAVTEHPRNLTDRMIRTIAESGGVIGINFCPRFLNEKGKVSRIRDMVRHIHHIYQTGGEDVLAIGTDLDGITGKLEINSCEKLEHLEDALKKRHMSGRILEKMWSRNAKRVLKEIL